RLFWARRVDVLLQGRLVVNRLAGGERNGDPDANDRDYAADGEQQAATHRGHDGLAEERDNERLRDRADEAAGEETPDIRLRRAEGHVDDDGRRRGHRAHDGAGQEIVAADEAGKAPDGIAAIAVHQ